MRRLILSSVFAVACTLASVGAQAAAVFAAPDSLELKGEHAIEGYRISIFRPLREARPGGFPVVFMLDGNAAEQEIGAISPVHLLEAAGTAVVTIGYRNTERFNLAARSYDYTPARTPGLRETDPLHPERQTGGADHFLDFIEQTLIPAVAERLPLDRERLGLWGHSFGGLLVLHALQTRPGLFRCHIAASPSLWWHDDQMPERLTSAIVARSPSPFALLITRGTAEDPPPPPIGAAPIDHDRWRARTRSLPITPGTLAEQLQQLPEAHVAYQEFPELRHGEALSASIPVALRWFTDCSQP